MHQNPFTRYSNILLLRDESFRVDGLPYYGLRYGLTLLLIVTLFSGAGKLLTLRDVQSDPTLPEQVDRFNGVVNRVEETLLIAVPQRIPLMMEVWLPLEIERLYYETSDNIVLQARGYLSEVEDIAISIEPPLGTVRSRSIRLVGDWLATPFEVAGEWFFFALVVLLLARASGGAATLQHHLAMILFAFAPYLLMPLAYLPQDGAMGMSIHIIGRTLSVLVALWAFAIVVKGVCVVHRLPGWSAFWIVAAAASLVYLLLPLAAILFVAFLFL